MPGQLRRLRRLSRLVCREDGGLPSRRAHLEGCGHLPVAGCDESRLDGVDRIAQRLQLRVHSRFGAVTPSGGSKIHAIHHLQNDRKAVRFRRRRIRAELQLLMGEYRNVDGT